MLAKFVFLQTLWRSQLTSDVVYSSIASVILILRTLLVLVLLTVHVLVATHSNLLVVVVITSFLVFVVPYRHRRHHLILSLHHS